ncbi:MAG: hypothetical protein ACOX83_05130 [Candidatus Spyradocola sp.]|jgi:hypothetical protein
MRTSLCVFAALLLAAVLALTGAAGAARAGAAEPDWTVEVRKGDESALRGISLEIGLRCGDHLQWSSQVQMDGSAQTTVFSPTIRTLYDRGTPRSYAMLTAYDSFGASVSGGVLDVEEMEQEGYFAAPIQALYEQTLRDGTYAQQDEAEGTADSNADASITIGAPNPTAQARVDLSEYYEFLPLNFDLFIPYVNLELSQETRSAIAEFFRIPLPEGSWADVAIEVTPQGDLVGAELSSVESRLGIQALSAVAEDACFLALTNPYATEPLDLSHVSGGNGVYVLPLQREEENEKVTVTPDADALCNAYPLPADALPQGLFLGSDGETLHLYTSEGDALYMTVLDRASLLAGRGEALQRVWVCDLAEDELLTDVQDFGSFLLVRRSTAFATVLARGADGVYAPEMEADLVDLNNDLETGLSDGLAADYDGERLAVVALPQTFAENGCDPVVAVYDQEGLLCLARLHTSLADAVPAESNEAMELVEHGLAIALQGDVSGT